MPIPVNHEGAVTFPNGLVSVWSGTDITTAFQLHGRGRLYAQSDRLLKRLPAEEFDALHCWAPIEEEGPLRRGLGIICMHDCVSLALLQAVRDGHGRTPDLVVKTILLREPISARGILLPA